VVALRPDGTVLTGEAAERRGVTEPTRVAREFKRRLGDPTPIVVGGTPYGAETLMAHLLRGIVDQIAEQQGSLPDKVVLSHPANYGPYKLDLLDQVGHLAELAEVEYITEPQAAAVHYSSLERIEIGEVVAVYDLGGGTFDAALVRRTDPGFELLGTPDGMERFGGIDLDEAVFEHVRRSLGRAMEGLDPADAAATSALARLRQDCRAAKEGLSSDTDTSIPVMLPGLHTEVRLTRAEFEDMIRPRLRETMTTLERVVHSAGLQPADLARVLLVGGSSRIPLVSEMVREATGRPVGLGAHPKHAIALGAVTAGAVGATRQTAAVTVPTPLEEEVPKIEEEPAADETLPDSSSTPIEPGPEPEEEPPHPEEPVEERTLSEEPEQPRVAAAPPDRRFRLPRAGVAAALIVIVAVIAGVVFLGGSDDESPYTYGDDEALDQLWDGCDAGDWSACDQLFAAAPFDTEYSFYGETCGERLSAEGDCAIRGESQNDDDSPPPDDAVPPPDDGEPPPDDAVPPPDDGFPPVEGPAPAPNVLVTYTTGFMVPDLRGEWGSWFAEGGGEPPEDIASDFYPALGLYDLADPAVVAQHLAWMRQAGIGTVAVIWAGPDTPGAEVMPVLLEFVERYGLSIAVYLPGFERSPQEFLDLAILAKEMYGESPAWLRVPGRNGDEPQPILFLGLSDEPVFVEVDAWAPVLEEARSFGLTVVVDSWDPVWIEAGADGLLAGDLDGNYAWADALPDDALYVPMVSPGQSAGRIGQPELNEARRGGDRYREDWELAHGSRRPNLVLIYSFNRWSFGTQIEPAAPDHPERSDSPYLTYEPLGPEDYLFLTAEMVDAFGYR
jgi:actin-like ATPase involved in cell morphogenesis